MNSSTHVANRRHGPRPAFSALSLAMMAASGLYGLGAGNPVHAQATTGSIFGTAPAASGETVMARSASGVTREVAVGADGQYAIKSLPVGTYTVTLRSGGQTIATHGNVAVSVASGTMVPFAAAADAAHAQNLGAVQVIASAMPPIDVSSVSSSTIITASDLRKLPVARNAEAIALLAPGTVSGSGLFMGPGNRSMNLVAFGGSSVSENAYYVNGYTTGEPYRNMGGFQLPYGAIDQQETLTGGYSAKYGRSDGGVINQLGKRGTNEWHFGGQVVWQPRFLESSPVNDRYGNPAIPAAIPNAGSIDGLTHYQIAAPNLLGKLNQYRNDNKAWETVYSAYIGGPLIKDQLFMFLAAETTRTQSTNVRAKNLGQVQYNRDKDTKFYGKLDWNITDSNILELTALKNNQSIGAGSTYAFDTDTLRTGGFITDNDVAKDNAQFYIGHFTSYLTDAATLSILYGKARFQDPTIYANHSPLPFIDNPFGIAGIPHNSQTNLGWNSDHATNGTHGLRVDFDYKLGNHDLSAGIDNMSYEAHNQGVSQQNPFNPEVDYYWRYYPNNIVRKREIGQQTSMTMTQKAYYLQDSWQITPDLLLDAGVRNEHFTNYNDLGQAFVDEKNQWEPRIGVSWDVFGDSSFKVYGNAGRYYLALPDNAAERAANRSFFILTKYTYTGVNPDGTPIIDPNVAPVVSSPDGEFGLPKDPKQVAARNLKPEYLDEFIAGFDKKLGDGWVYGAKAMWRDLKAAIDDVCDNSRVHAKMTSMGLNPDDYSNATALSTCILFNPGKTNTFLVVSNDGSNHTLVPMTPQDWGFQRGAVRKIGSLDLYLEHPFDGRWYGRLDYTFSRGFGNTEGQVRSDFGQMDVSKTEDWDSWQLMDGQYGELANIRKHQIRFRGAYQITPEWLVSAVLLAQSGMPKECLGYYGPDGVGDPSGYNGGGGGNYHWCHGVRIPPGSVGHTPWTEQLNLGVHYMPAFADHRLGINLDILNVLDQQRALQADAIGESAYNNGVGPDGVTPAPDLVSINNSYGEAQAWQPPRTVRLSVTYDY